MITIARFDHPASLDAPEMFFLRAARDMWAEALLAKVGDLDMYETVELGFSYGMYPQYHRYIHLVASEADSPTSEADVLGVATIDLPMADNRRLADFSIVVRSGRRREGIGTALHAAALKVAEEYERSTIQVWTWAPLRIPEGAHQLPAETGVGAVDADSPESKFLTGHGYVLGQVERLSRLQLPGVEELYSRRDEALSGKLADYEIITILGSTPVRFLAGAAALTRVMVADVPTGEMDVEDEVWDEERLVASDVQVETAGRDQLQTFVRHVPSGELAGFTRLFRDRRYPEVAHQWETLVVGEHRGHGLGLLMKAVNHAAVAEFWPEVTRLITGNASENTHMLAINIAMGYEPYAGAGFWELRRGADG